MSMQIMNYYKTLIVSCCIVAVVAIPVAGQDREEWFTGNWDSSIYNRSEKPKTVALRIEILDAEKGVAVSGAEVQLRGGWLEERIGTAGDEVGIPYEPQEREFNLTATSGPDGIAVCALSWEKEYPWRFGRPEPKVDKRGNTTFYDVHTSWKRAVDDIEKIREIEIRHPCYKFRSIPFDFSYLTEFGQDRRSESQDPRLFKEFENAWHQEMKKPGVKFCVLDIGKSFDDFANKRCTRPEFFKKIKQKDFGTVYRQPSNWFSVGEHPQSECGPFFVYLVDIRLEPLSEAPTMSGTHRPNTRKRMYPIDEYLTETIPEETKHHGDESATAQTRSQILHRHDAELQNMSQEQRKRRYEEAERQVMLKEQRRQQREEAQRMERIAESQREKERLRLSSVASSNESGVAAQGITKKKQEEIGRDMGMPMGIVGVNVSYIDPMSPAYKAGLREGMIVSSVKFGHSNITPTSENYFNDIMRNIKPGQRVELGVWRQSQGNRIRAGYSGSEQKRKWYRDKIIFQISK